MKLALITLGLLATTGVVYAACMFCCERHQRCEMMRRYNIELAPKTGAQRR